MKKYNRILICGLPGSGKTTLARNLAHNFHVPHHCADTVREMTGNWDFTSWGRYQQYEHMRNQWGILDFVCPKQQYRDSMNYDFSIWMNTVKESEYKDTDEIFEPFNNADLIITDKINTAAVDMIWYLAKDRFKPGYSEMLRYLKEIDL